METIEFAGRKYQYEKLQEDYFKKGACAFKMVGEDGNTQYLVFTPRTLSWDDKEIKTPNDGIVCAACPCEQAALMVASSIHIASNLASIHQLVNEEVGRKTSEIADKLDLDLDALKAEVKRLKDEGKSPKEVEEILKPRMEEFMKKHAADKGGEW